MNPFGDGQRDERGRFTPGNPGGPGNPHGGKAAQLRAALVAAVSPDDIRDIAASLVDRAKGGDPQAVRVLFDRLFGRPAQEAGSGASGEGHLVVVFRSASDDPDDAPAPPRPA